MSSKPWCSKKFKVFSDNLNVTSKVSFEKITKMKQWRIQNYCRTTVESIHKGNNIKLRHNVLLMISLKNIAVPL